MSWHRLRFCWGGCGERKVHSHSLGLGRKWTPLFVGTVRCEDADGSKDSILLFGFLVFFTTLRFCTIKSISFQSSEQISNLLNLRKLTLLLRSNIVLVTQKIQVLITAKNGTWESVWLLIFWRCFECASAGWVVLYNLSWDGQWLTDAISETFI